jgi:hypothetical protein
MKNKIIILEFEKNEQITEKVDRYQHYGKKVGSVLK